jgi:hypothetical protein
MRASRPRKPLPERPVIPIPRPLRTDDHEREAMQNRLEALSARVDRITGRRGQRS